MTTTTIRPSSTTDDGYVICYSTTYASVLDGTGSLSSSNSSTSIVTGQLKSGSTYYNYEGFTKFDCSSISSTDTVSNVTFEITTATSLVSTASDLEIRLASPSSPLSNADYVPQSSLGALCGTIAAASIAASTLYDVTLNSTGIAAVQAALGVGTVGFVVVSKNFVNGTPPISAERTQFRASEDTISTNRPALIVDHAAGGGGVVIPVFDHHYRLRRAA